MINDIEEEWSRQYEDRWNTYRQKIESVVMTNNTMIQEFDKSFLMCFFNSMDWRGFTSCKEFQETYSSIVNACREIFDCKIPEEDRYLPMLDTQEKEMRHCLLLNMCRKFLCATDNCGNIETISRLSEEIATFAFVIADGQCHFVTSDNPTFEYLRTDGFKEKIMPVTPKILMIQCRNSDNPGCYGIHHINDDVVRLYNKAISDNAEERLFLMMWPTQI